MNSSRPGKIRCDACPVLCYIAEGRSGACDRYANHDGELVRLDPLTVIAARAEAVPFMDHEGGEQDWDGDIVRATGRSSPLSALAPPIPTTSRPRSSSARRSTASTWSRS